MFTCSKKYLELPFAHRQPFHKGHCSTIHGHNWTFEFEFAAKERDECGFVVDFGKLKWLKLWLDRKFDHTLVLNDNDPMLGHIRDSLGDMATITLVPNCSSEGIAEYLMREVGKRLLEYTDNRVSLIKVKVIEDSRNSATLTI